MTLLAVYKTAFHLYNTNVKSAGRWLKWSAASERYYPHCAASTASVSERLPPTFMSVHYENGAREPGLPLVCRICDYFGVSADYLLGRIDLSPEAPLPSLERLQAAMAAEDDPDVKQAAQACISSAAERLRLRMSGEGGEIAAAEHASDMAAAELELMRAVSRRGKKE